MNAENLLKLYERIAEAPDAITRLRRLILDLALRGNLVTQDSSDETRDHSINQGDSRAPFAIPRNWHWARIGDHLELLNGMPFKPTDWVSTGLKIVRIQNLNKRSASFNSCNPAMARARSLIDDGAFLISWSGTPGTSFGAFIWDRGPAVLNQHIFRCDFKTEDFTGAYLRLAINGRLDEMIEKAHGGVGVQHITKGRLESMLLPLPPKAEQHRIVTKFDELMVLCDQLEAARNKREATRDRLATASLARLTAPDPETFHADARFALSALPALSTRPDQIKQLRQTILNLAVRGLLGQGSADDEPIGELLKEIARESPSRWVSPQPPLKDHQYAIPDRWQWVVLGQLIVAGPQNGLSPKPTSREDAPKAITLTATTRGMFDPSCFKRVEVAVREDSGFWLREGDLIFQRGNTREYVGMAAIYTGPALTYLYPDLMIRVRVSERVNLRYVHLASVAPPARQFLSVNATGAQLTMPKINQATLLSLPIPLPPRQEQDRIVARIDELTAMCDQLEASLITTNDIRRRLLDALLHEVLAPAQEMAA